VSVCVRRLKYYKGGIMCYEPLGHNIICYVYIGVYYIYQKTRTGIILLCINIQVYTVDAECIYVHIYR